MVRKYIIFVVTVALAIGVAGVVVCCMSTIAKPLGSPCATGICFMRKASWNVNMLRKCILRSGKIRRSLNVITVGEPWSRAAGEFE